VTARKLTYDGVKYNYIIMEEKLRKRFCNKTKICKLAEGLYVLKCVGLNCERDISKETPLLYPLFKPTTLGLSLLQQTQPVQLHTQP